MAKQKDRSKSDQIDDAIADLLLKSLKEGQTVLDSDGNPTKIDATAAMVSAAIKYVSRKGGGNRIPVDGQPAGNLVNHMNRHDKMFPNRRNMLTEPIENIQFPSRDVG